MAVKTTFLQPVETGAIWTAGGASIALSGTHANLVGTTPNDATEVAGDSAASVSGTVYRLETLPLRVVATITFRVRAKHTIIGLPPVALTASLYLGNPNDGGSTLIKTITASSSFNTSFVTFSSVVTISNCIGTLWFGLKSVIPPVSSTSFISISWVTVELTGVIDFNAADTPASVF